MSVSGPRPFGQFVLALAAAAVLSPRAPPLSVEAPKDTPPAGLTRRDWNQIRRTVQDSQYHATRAAKRGEAAPLQASNRRQAYQTTFRREGIEIVPQRAGVSWRLGLSVTGYGYQNDLKPLQPAEPQAAKERVEYRRGPVTEWYLNRPSGLEQGFELQEPQPRRDAPLVVAMSVKSDLTVEQDRDGASFNDVSGTRLLHYTRLKAWDADARPLEARIEVVDRGVRLIVEAQTARFPVTVDPTLVHEAQLLGHGDPIGEAGDRFGYSVSVSGDILVVGAPDDTTPTGSYAGSANVFVRTGTTWTEQQKLMASDGADLDRFGSSVSVSGETVVVGAPGALNAGSAYVFVRTGLTWIEQQKLIASDGVVNDFFGWSVSVFDDTVVVGTPSDDTAGGANAGSAYVFARTGTAWIEQQKLLASDGAANDVFGISVSVSGETLVVGASEDDTPAGVNAGSAYVFVRSGTIWTEQQKLLASDGAARWFGNTVSVSGDTVVVDAPLDANPPGDYMGSVWVFVRMGGAWTEQQRLTPSDAAAGDFFGGSVSLSSETIVVGAYVGGVSSAYVFVRVGATWTEQQKLNVSHGAEVSVSGDTVVVGSHLDANPTGNDAGSAWVFVRSGTAWTEQQRLFALDGADGDYFGYSVSVSGNTAVVGAPNDDGSAGPGAGSAYVFVRTGTAWTEQQKLTAPGGWNGGFGPAVAVAGDTLVVGAPNDTTAGGAAAGSAYVFVRNGTTWTEQQKLTASDGAAGDAFGSSVSVSGDTVVVGVPYDDTLGGISAGSAYVYVRTGATWTEQQKLTASDGAAGDVLGWSASVSGDTVVLGAPFDDSPSAGSAYVFVRTGTAWTEQQKLASSDGMQYDEFGASVSVSGDTVVVGAFFHDTAAGDAAGSAYVFVRNGTTWSEQQELTASNGTESDFFGYAVAVSGDTVVAGATWAENPIALGLGTAYVFVRSGATWTEQQRLNAPNGGFQAFFGFAVSVFGDTVLVGAYNDDTSEGDGAGSVHVFRLEQADLSVTKTDGQATAVPGQPVSYTITVANAGPTIAGATVTDTLPAAMLGATWTCTASPGSSCTASGSGSINDTVGLLAGATATYTLTGTIDPAATGVLVNTASVWAPAGVDPNPANDSATDTDSLTPQADLSMAKTDGHATVVRGEPVTYTITVANPGPSVVMGATVADTVPATLLGAAWTCLASPGSACTASGAGSIGDTVNLLEGGTATYTLIGTLDPAAAGTLVNTATVAAPAGTADPNSANDSATDTDTILVGPFIEGELAHGYQRQYDLAALPGSFADQDVFRMLQRAHASYEVVLDGTSGDLGSGSGPILERLGSDASTVIQGSSAAGAGGSRTLRWMNALDTPVSDELVRVKSAGCTTTCDAADVYRLTAFETTGFVPRFNNSGTQITVLVLQNLGGDNVDVDIRFWSGTGGSLGGTAIQTLGPRQSYVLNTSTIAPGSSGSITVANTGRYGQLTGKAVAVEPATGFSFDTTMGLRLR